MVETEFERAPRDQTITSRQAIETNDGLKDGRLARTLRSKHCYSWQFDELLHTNVSQVINDADELLELGVHEGV